MYKRQALDRAKAITEISKLREDRILKVLQFVNQLEQQEAAGREAQKTQVGAQADAINAETQLTDEYMQKQAQQQESQGLQSMMQNIDQGG